MRKTASISTACLGILALSACGTVGGSSSGAPASGASAPVSGAYVNVVKLTGIAWFDRMNVGVEKFALDSKLKASQVGPATDSPEQQVSIIQGLIAQKPAAMGIVPSDPGAVQAVIDQARAAGIKVVTHEAASLTGVDADIEAFDNKTYGEKIMNGLSKCMEGKGEYVQFVGKLTAQTHMEWSAAALNLQEQEYPNMKRVGDPVESNDNADTAYQKTKQLLQSNPNINGFQGASSQDVPGIARAIEEAGLQDQTCVHGTGVPSETKPFVKSGAIDAIYLWDPALAGEAMLKAAQLLAEGKTLETGTDLGVKGYESVTQSGENPKVFIGDAALAITEDDIDSYDF